MLARFISFYLCALLGLNEVAAQLDLGTYKIVNLGSQSSLCANNASGELKYYVTARGNPCPHGLWVLGAGDELNSGVYTVKNIGLGSNVGVNKTSGSVVANNGLTSFVVSSVPGNSYYIIKLPNSDLVWTVRPTMISHSDILLQPPNGLYGSQLWTFTPTDGNDAIASHSEDFTVQARSPQNATLNLNGTLAYSDFEAMDWSYTYPAVAEITAALIFTTIKVTADNGLAASGQAWGFGIGYFRLVGALSYNSEDTLLSTGTEFTIVAGGDEEALAGIAFTINGQVIAWMLLGGAGAGFTASHGTVTWSAG